MIRAVSRLAALSVIAVALALAGPLPAAEVGSVASATPAQTASAALCAGDAMSDAVVANAAAAGGMTQIARNTACEASMACIDGCRSRLDACQSSGASYETCRQILVECIQNCNELMCQ